MLVVPRHVPSPQIGILWVLYVAVACMDRCSDLGKPAVLHHALRTARVASGQVLNNLVIAVIVNNAFARAEQA